MTVKNRITQLEKKHAPKVESRIVIYFNEPGKGYTTHPHAGPYYPTVEAMAAAERMNLHPKDKVIKVGYADPPITEVFLPDNGRA